MVSPSTRLGRWLVRKRLKKHHEIIINGLPDEMFFNDLSVVSSDKKITSQVCFMRDAEQFLFNIKSSELAAQE